MYIKLESTILCTSSLSSYKVFMPLFECVDEHWMLLVADLKWRQFVVYDSLLTKRAPTRTDLQNSGKEAVAAAWSVATDYADAKTWQTDHPSCPQQGNGHDCVVFVMVFMDLISMNSKPFSSINSTCVTCGTSC